VSLLRYETLQSLDCGLPTLLLGTWNTALYFVTVIYVSKTGLCMEAADNFG